MKRILFIVVLTLVSVFAYCQIGVKDGRYYTTCTYDKAYLKSDNTGIISFEDFEVSLDKETNEYIIEVFIDRGTVYQFKVGYNKTVRDGSDVAYLYEGVRSNFMNERVVVFTRTKLSAYVKNAGFKSLDGIKNFDKQAISFIFPKTYLVFSIAPIKNTPEAHRLKEERKKQEEAKRVAKEIAKDKLEALLPFGKEYVKDSLKREVVKEFFSNKGDIKSSYLKGSNDYIAVVDTNKQVKFIQKGSDVFDESLKNEWLKKDTEYEKNNAKVINGRVFFEMWFNPKSEIKEQTYECSVRYDKKTNSYIYYKEPYRSNLFDESNQMEAPKDITEIIENNIKKKGMYSLFWETLDGKLVSLSYIKNGFMEKDYTTELYSIYK